jgi:hypothetical protein
MCCQIRRCSCSHFETRRESSAEAPWAKPNRRGVIIALVRETLGAGQEESNRVSFSVCPPSIPYIDGCIVI